MVVSCHPAPSAEVSEPGSRVEVPLGQQSGERGAEGGGEKPYLLGMA